MAPLLVVNHLEKYYGGSKAVTKAIDDISFSIENGEFVGIMGASGSGKTTLMNLISTIDTPSAGSVVLCEKELTELTEKQISAFRRENLGFIFQELNLLDTLTLKENIALALTISDRFAENTNAAIDKIASKLGISTILEKFPYEVSGGQRQRCACARALATNPRLILADEPTGALDSRSARQLMELFSSLNTELGSTIFMVTHDPFCASYCKRILFLKDGKIFNEIRRGDKERRLFFGEILNVTALLGGDLPDVYETCLE